MKNPPGGLLIGPHYAIIRNCSRSLIGETFCALSRGSLIERVARVPICGRMQSASARARFSPFKNSSWVTGRAVIVGYNIIQTCCLWMLKKKKASEGAGDRTAEQRRFQHRCDVMSMVNDCLIEPKCDNTYSTTLLFPTVCARVRASVCERACVCQPSGVTGAHHRGT